LSREGYQVKGELPTEEEIKEMILTAGRNIGSWAPGELDSLISRGKAVRLPIDQYNNWYKTLDPAYRKEIEKDWGRPQNIKIMVKDKNFIIPCVTLGNGILVPQPSRGWHDEPTKLYHSTTLWPHHQYTAFYLWLKHGFKADAIVSLGTHGSHGFPASRQA
jgi:cobaltochelatase CobN